MVCPFAALREQSFGGPALAEASVSAEDVIAWLSTNMITERHNVGAGVSAAAVNAALHQSHALVHDVIGEAELQSCRARGAPAAYPSP